MTVLGIGGLFFRSRDPQARAAWYSQHLGIGAGAEGAGAVWEQQAGATVFAPFAADSSYFAVDQPFMLNLRVTDLDELVAGLESAGIDVERRPEWDSEYGRFVRIHDPEGLPIELWETPEEH
ncbi:VOC family protein [Herbiconiux moechotypicola]|uniref:Glyoxalase/bleomycin resistance/dioxygenase family protein n=1 Tax=Herbiconiux moechotypicola TaxID=637393 RepID=A0ABP5QCF9_9MICO|nr:VOC family protein [Herbiconiux moechotypicola]MCS5729677.1 VOC family protein [Herbiconiux moechotypicola]